MPERTTRPKRAVKRVRAERPRAPRQHRTPRAEPPQASGGGDSGRGTIDGDGGGHKPERPDNGRARLLIAIGILAVGAGVMTARLLAKTGPARGRRG